MTPAMSSSTGTQTWVEQPYRLQFMLGERHLFAVSFRALVLKTHFLKLESPPEKLILALEGPDSDTDVVVMGSVPVQKVYPTLSRSGEWLVYVPDHFPRYYVAITGTFESYLMKCSAKTRSTLRRKVRKFQEFSGGKLDFREYSTPEEVEEFYPLALELSQRTYQHRLLDAGLPESASFISTIRALALADQMRAYLLFHEGRPVAYLYCPAIDGVLTYAYLGYDATYSEWSCGTVLQYLVFERLFAEQTFRIFDFTQGEGEHKKLFATGMTPCAQVLWFRPKLRNFVVVGCHAGVALATRKIVELLDFLGLKRRIKRILRRG